MNVIFAIISGLVMLFLGVITGTFVGGIVGWCVDLVFPFVAITLNKLAATTLTGFELGATLGFVGSFFRSKCEK